MRFSPQGAWGMLRLLRLQRAQLQEWSAKLDLWQARARKPKADVKIRSQQCLEQLQNALATEAKKSVGRVSRRLDR